MALLLQYLVYFGNAVGRGPYYQVENDKHFANLFLLLAGEHGEGAQGPLGRSRSRHLRHGRSRLGGNCINGGMSSGEGVLHAIRDPVYAMRKGVERDDRSRRRRQTAVARRARVLFGAGGHEARGQHSQPHRPRRLGLPAGAANADQEHPHPRQPTATSRSSATSPTEELRQKLDHTSMANGYANRFIYGCVHRSKMLPFGGDALESTELGTRTKDAIDKRPQFRARDHDRGRDGAVGCGLSAAVARSAGPDGLADGARRGADRTDRADLRAARRRRSRSTASTWKRGSRYGRSAMSHIRGSKPPRQHQSRSP